MAGKTIYTGDMIAALESKIDTMVTTLQAHTTALGNINTAVAQSVSALNVKAGVTDFSLVVNDADTAVVCTVADTAYDADSVKIFCNGVITFACNIKNSSISDANIGYKLNGGTAVYPLAEHASLGTSYVAKTFNIPVEFGDTVTLCVYTGSSGRTLTIQAGATLKYDLMDIVNNGAIVNI